MKNKICGIATKALTIKWFMLENLKYVGAHDFKPYIICEPSSIFETENMENVQYIPVPMNRGNVSIWEVLSSICKLYKIFRKEKFDIIQYASSNAGLYASLAGYLARVPVRVYCQWGISYTDYSGAKYHFYKLIEKITCIFSTNVQPDSYGNLRFAVQEKLYKVCKGNVIYNGSACGVDLQKFNRTSRQEWRTKTREKYGIDENIVVFGYVGRLALEKGVNELFKAYLGLNEEDTKLMMVGPNYGLEDLDQDLLVRAKASNDVVFVGPVENPAEYYAAMDFLILPSYREGFGMVVVEAAGVGTPSIITNINGPTEFVKDNHNGLYCDVRSAYSLQMAMKKAINMEATEYERLRNNAYIDAVNKFDCIEYKKHFLEDRIYLLKH